ncbi:MAG: oxygen-independent coproporphyrinogen III oxidase [Firmicutes bacterium]|nr:oxygen-independent coproporphyrinogen III oxidase [Bacillota bacterium]HKM18282.1 radical SAM family heme chaperone HemW [Limnochordia bacterium]
MLGVYVHIPFCLRKCGYCDFHSTAAAPPVIEAYLQALANEIEFWARQTAGELCSTLYIGGGTPTILTPGQLDRILTKLAAAFNFEPGFEFTVEANPGTLTPEKAQALAQAGANRISLGAQAFDDGLLQKIGRAHTVGQIHESVGLIRKAGIDNINLDLIEGLPGQSLDQWQAALAQAVQLKPSHFSCYSLILEENTPFYQAYQEGELTLPPEEETAAMFAYTQEYLPQQGYCQYEISNYAKPGREARHNLIYWQTYSYLGLGSGAHGYYRQIRYSSTEDLGRYIRSWRKHEPAYASWEPVTADQAMDEMMFLGLRLVKGVNLNSFYQRFQCSVHEVYGAEVDRLAARGLIEEREGFLRLTKLGRSLGNLVFSAFVRPPLRS